MITKPSHPRFLAALAIADCPLDDARHVKAGVQYPHYLVSMPSAENPLTLPDLTDKNTCTTLNTDQYPCSILWATGEWPQMAQIQKEISGGQVLALPRPTPRQSLAQTTQLYNNERKCNRMQHHATNLRKILAPPRLTSPHLRAVPPRVPCVPPRIARQCNLFHDFNLS